MEKDFDLPLHEKSHWVHPRICIGAKPMENFHWYLESPDYDKRQWVLVSLVEYTPYFDIEHFNMDLTLNKNTKDSKGRSLDKLIENILKFKGIH